MYTHVCVCVCILHKLWPVSFFPLKMYHMVLCQCIVILLLVATEYFIAWTFHNSFNQKLIDGYLGYFWSLAFLNGGTVRILALKSFLQPLQVGIWGYISESGVAEFLEVQSVEAFVILMRIARFFSTESVNMPFCYTLTDTIFYQSVWSFLIWLSYQISVVALICISLIWISLYIS